MRLSVHAGGLWAAAGHTLGRERGRSNVRGGAGARDWATGISIGTCTKGSLACEALAPRCSSGTSPRLVCAAPGAVGADAIQQTARKSVQQWDGRPLLAAQAELARAGRRSRRARPVGGPAIACRERSSHCQCNCVYVSGITLLRCCTAELRPKWGGHKEGGRVAATEHNG